jgi:hypothetical protein
MARLLWCSLIPDCPRRIENDRFVGGIAGGGAAAKWGCDTSSKLRSPVAFDGYNIPTVGYSDLPRRPCSIPLVCGRTCLRRDRGATHPFRRALDLRGGVVAGQISCSPHPLPTKQPSARWRKACRSCVSVLASAGCQIRSEAAVAGAPHHAQAGAAGAGLRSWPAGSVEPHANHGRLSHGKYRPWPSSVTHSEPQLGLAG